MYLSVKTALLRLRDTQGAETEEKAQPFLPSHLPAHRQCLSSLSITCKVLCLPRRLVTQPETVPTQARNRDFAVRSLPGIKQQSSSGRLLGTAEADAIANYSHQQLHFTQEAQPLVSKAQELASEEKQAQFLLLPQ